MVLLDSDAAERAIGWAFAFGALDTRVACVASPGLDDAGSGVELDICATGSLARGSATDDDTACCVELDVCVAVLLVSDAVVEVTGSAVDLCDIAPSPEPEGVGSPIADMSA